MMAGRRGKPTIAELKAIDPFASLPNASVPIVFLALCAHPTRKFDVLLEHELLVLSAPPNGTYRVDLGILS